MVPARGASIGGLVGTRRREGIGHAVVILLVGATVLAAELNALSLDHGTHLLVALVLVAGVALLIGPGPAASGLVVGGAASVGVSPALLDGTAAHVVSIQTAVYVAVGAAIVVLARLARRTQRPGGPARRRLVAAPADGHGQPVLLEPLTERELEVLRLAASGIAVEAIGARLFLSPNTVKTHLTHAYAKLGVRGRSDAIRAALHFGCLTPADICPHRYPPA